jgi:hypothetical protein
VNVDGNTVGPDLAFRGFDYETGSRPLSASAKTCLVQAGFGGATGGANPALSATGASRTPIPVRADLPCLPRHLHRPVRQVACPSQVGLWRKGPNGANRRPWKASSGSPRRALGASSALNAGHPDGYATRGTCYRRGERVFVRRRWHAGRVTPRERRRRLLPPGRICERCGGSGKRPLRETGGRPSPCPACRGIGVLRSDRSGRRT